VADRAAHLKAAVEGHADADKRTKVSVGYARAAGFSRCSKCRHWIPGGACEIVEGDIRPEYWCRLFRRSVSAE
jgi:hypothetical protein